MRRLTIEERESGMFRLSNGTTLDIMGRSVEDVLYKALLRKRVGPPFAFSTFDVGEALNTLMGGDWKR